MINQMMNKMRRADREITDFNEIVEVLGRADTIRVGLFNGEYPYIVPVSFGMEVVKEPENQYCGGYESASEDCCCGGHESASDDCCCGDAADSKVVLYFHSAKKGLKNDCINANDKVCVEADIFHMIQRTEVGITTRFESVIGFGRIEELEGDDKVYGLQKIVEKYGYPEYPIDRCKGLPMTAVFKITLDQITGKRNLPE